MMNSWKIVTLLTVLALIVLMAACGGVSQKPQTPVSTEVLTASDSLTSSTVGSAQTPVAASAPIPTPMSAEAPTMGDDQRSQRDVSRFMLFSAGPGAAAYVDEGASSVEDVLDEGLYLAGASPVQIAFRGTVAPGSVRCGWRGVARTPTQRETAIRFWLELEVGDSVPSPEEVERRFNAGISGIDAAFPETAKANFAALARGGLSTEYMFLSCYADYIVHEYSLGSGPESPNKVTVSYSSLGEARSYDLHRRAHEAGEFGAAVLMTEAEHAEWRSQVLFDAELVLSSILEGREGVVFVAPMELTTR